jgi:hypothetical protein
MVENLWSLANGITSFAVLQALAFLYALGRVEFVSAISNGVAQTIIILVTLAFTIAYSVGVSKCRRLASEISSDHKQAWKTVTRSRIACKSGVIY